MGNSNGTLAREQSAGKAGGAISKLALEQADRTWDSCSVHSQRILAWAGQQSGQSSPSVCSSDDTSSTGPGVPLQGDDLLAALAADHAEAAAQPYKPHDFYVHGPPKPACYQQRGSTATTINKLRATRNGEIESVLRLLCKVFEVETATVALLTGECVYLTGACGALPVCVCPDRWGFCGWSFLNSVHELLVVEDMSKDTRFCQNYFVVEPQFNLQFYVAAPLLSSNGHRLGTLCVMGQQPRSFDATRAQVLSNVAEMLVRQLERTWALQVRAAGDPSHLLQRTPEVYDRAYLFVSAEGGAWTVLHMNEPAVALLGVGWSASYDELADFSAGRRSKAAFQGWPLQQLVDTAGTSTVWGGEGWEFEVEGAHGARGTALEGQRLRLHFRLASSDGLDAQQPFYVGIPAWLQLAADGFGQNYFFVEVRQDRAGAGTQQQQQAGGERQQLQAQRAFGGDSAETLHQLKSKAVWLPRGLEAGRGCPVEGLLLGSLLGAGSYGRVYRGLYKGRPVAVKVVNNMQEVKVDASGTPLEVSLTAGLGHPNLVRVVTHALEAPGAGQRPSWRGGTGRCWMVLEYCDKPRLADAVVRGYFRSATEPLSSAADLRVVAVTALEVAAGMAYLHAKGVVHGDLSGGNVLLSSSPAAGHGFVAKVGDFGLVRSLATDAPARLTSNVYGTMGYMPPELLMEGVLSQATDVYSFGVLLWEMLTSTRAWAGMSHAAIICQVAVMGRSLELPPGLPPCLHQLLASCLDRDPNNRPGFDQIAQQLQDFVQRYSAGEEREEQPIGTFGCLPGETGEAGTLVFLGCAK